MTRNRWIPDAVAAASLFALVLSQVLTFVADPHHLLGSLLQAFSTSLAFGGVGWLLWRRLPANPIGWCFSLAGLTTAALFVAHAAALPPVSGPPGQGRLVRAAAVLDTYGWTVAVPLAVTLPLLLLPDGRLLSSRWRPVLSGVIVGGIVCTFGFFTLPGPIDNALYGDVVFVNPFGLRALSPLSMVLAVIGLAMQFCGVLAGVVAVARRFRRSRGVERQQLRWVLLGGGCAGVGVAASTASQDPGVRGVVAGAVGGIGLLALPLCIGIAVLRYRLYDLGRIVSRTVSYVLVTAMVVGIYLTTVTSVARLSASHSSFAVAASTLAAAAVFQPLRRRVQSTVDARFNRAKYDSERTMEDFRRRLRDEVDLAVVRADLLRVVEGTLQPAGVGIWLRDGAR